MEIATPQLGFTNLQIELLKLFARQVTHDDLDAIKRLIARYFAEKAMDEADLIWQQKGYKADEILDMHLRTPYKPEK